jgi:hypothetical protein
MLLLLIALAWLAVVVVVVALCQVAGRADRGAHGTGEGEPETLRDGLTVWDPAAARVVRARGRRLSPRARDAAGGHPRGRSQAARARGLGG